MPKKEIQLDIVQLATIGRMCLHFPLETIDPLTALHLNSKCIRQLAEQTTPDLSQLLALSIENENLVKRLMQICSDLKMLLTDVSEELLVATDIADLTNRAVSFCDKHAASCRIKLEICQAISTPVLAVCRPVTLLRATIFLINSVIDWAQHSCCGRITIGVSESIKSASIMVNIKTTLLPKIPSRAHVSFFQDLIRMSGGMPRFSISDSKAEFAYNFQKSDQ
ncbi:MAG: hypothetical protein AABZ06_01890 [Bdellovibrionota bacterium]